MKGLVTLWMGVIAGCGGSGAVLEIHTHADHVLVFVASSACSQPDGTACPTQLSWTSAGPAANVDGVFDVIAEQPDRLAVHGGVASYTLRAGDKAKIDRIVAIGFDANDMPIEAGRLAADGVKVPTDTSEVWRIDLAPAAPIEDNPDAKPSDGVMQRVHLWGGDAKTCLAWQHFDTTWTREVLAPADDHDCDGYAQTAEAECNDFWLDAKSATGLCLDTGQQHFPAACTLGVYGGCVDGVGSLEPCVEKQGPVVCVPDALCSACADPIDPLCVARAIADGRANGSVPVISCAFPGTQDAATTPCDLNGVTMTFTIPFGCADMKLAPRQLPPTTAFGNGSFTLGTAQMHIGTSPSLDSCPMAIQWNAGTPTMLDNPFVAEVIEANGSVLLVPLELSFVPGGVCPTNGTPIACEVNYRVNSGATDGIWSCAAP